jgi:hypothetical protein
VSLGAAWQNLLGRRSVALVDCAGAIRRMTPQEVLARYPGPVTLYAAKADTAGAPFLAALFFASLFFVDIKGSKPVAIAMGGFFLAYALVHYFRDTTIELNVWGFATRDFGGAKTECAWRATSEFRYQWSRGGMSISYIDDNYGQAYFGPQRNVPRVYPFNAVLMTSLMNAWRARALGID